MVDKRTVCFLIKLHGCAEAEMGLGDGLDGKFVRPLRVVGCEE